MADTQFPATDQPAYSTDPNSRNTITINGTVYTVLDVGYIFGNTVTSCLILSDTSLFVNPIPDGFQVCPVCWHNEGIPLVPDWEICGTPSGGHGLLIKLKSAWFCHCIQLIQFVSVDTTMIDPNVSFSSPCGSPKIPPINIGLGEIGAIAGLTALGALAFLSLANGAGGIASYSGAISPEFDQNKFNLTPETGINPTPGTAGGNGGESGPEDAPGGAERPKATDEKKSC